MTRILVTGGLGFIGSEYVRQIIQDISVKSVTILDSFTYAANSLNYLEFLKYKNIEIR